MKDAAFRAAFCADDSPIEIIPLLDFESSLPLLASSAVGPWKAGLRTTVPLWMGISLQQRSLAHIAIPGWLQVDNLATILDFEKNQEVLWRDEARLPRSYYEICQRLKNVIQKEQPAVLVLIEDILQVRLDKLRQQFQQLLMDSSRLELGQEDLDLFVEVSGIGSQELAVLQSFVVMALNDRRSFQTAPKVLTEKEPASGNTAPTRSRLPVRRFRKAP